MAAHAGTARTDGGPPGAADPAPSSFEYRSRLKVLGLPLVHVVRGIDPKARFLAVAVNGSVVRRADWSDITLTAGDAVEIVRPFQGG